MKRESAVFSVVRGILLTVFSFSITVQPAAWEWPVTGADFTLDADGSDSSLQTGVNWSFRFVNRSSGDVPVIAPISGELIFIDEVRSSENREGDLLVIRNANELWVSLRLYGIAWADRSFLLAETVSTGDTLGRAEVVELEVYDRLRQRYVNPRALFPYTDRFPGDGLPPLTFLQSGFVRDPSKLTPGTVQVVVARQDVQFSRLPRQIFILRDGLLQAQHSFVFRDETRSLTTPDGSLLLFETTVFTGLNEIEIEARRFDGSIERRTVQLFVPETSRGKTEPDGPSPGGSMALDTP